MEFETTDNIYEYEALVLGLKAAKDMAIDNLAVFGDSKLIINQIKNIYQAKQLSSSNTRMRCGMWLKTSFWNLISPSFLEMQIKGKIL
jgi:ribonuclease HI